MYNYYRLGWRFNKHFGMKRDYQIWKGWEPTAMILRREKYMKYGAAKKE